MYEAYMNNKFTNSLIMFIMFFIVVALSPFLFLFQFFNTLRKRLLPSENMAGKVVLITGASSGIGAHIAYQYAKRGAYLVIVARREEQLIQVAQKALEFGSPDVLHVCADVSKVDDCKRFVDETINHFGRLDHLVTNAGIQSYYTSDMDVTNFRDIMEVNYWGSIYPASFALPYLKKSKGKIVVNASSDAFFHPPYMGFISGSKAALVTFFESLRLELGSTVKITMVTLGFVKSAMTSATISNKEEHVITSFKKDAGDVFPEMGTEVCAKHIVDGACRGERFVTEPKYFKIFFLVKFAFPELMQLYLWNVWAPRLRKIF